MLGAPVVILAYIITNDLPEINFDIRYLGFPLISIPISILCLSPIILLHYFTLKKLSDNNIPVLLKKTIATFIVAIGILTYYYLIIGKLPAFFFGLDLRIFPISYIFTFLAGTFVFKLRTTSNS